MAIQRILVVRLSSMGDVIHTLPAVATLKHSFRGCHVAWIVDPKWAPLLTGNPYIDEVIPFNRRNLASIWEARCRLSGAGFDTVFDFQGLIKSALVASAARPETIYGFHQSQVRERLSALFYSHGTRVQASHVVDRNLELAAASGAANTVKTFPLPAGTGEGRLPEEPFVLAAPLAGWPAKQWPLENYPKLARLLHRKLKMPLVVNGAPNSAGVLEALPDCLTHFSSVDGLIDATRRARAVIGIDSGPLHMAAALDKPGVALFGPTDPERNGPYGNSFTVLRDAGAVTTYKREKTIGECMKRITPETVIEALAARLGNETPAPRRIS